ncbi:hypothetical protein [Manganibacter manganicus]|uniref:Uncharacterized protein n=1 Tax=Manganibacter manganicus TaxID=1873176 RepID=A0A1V8RR12_9HYPH|nr:hypothetical protein [Pseudaminobacter manganicus]OQM75595.1 hypothetical protein BFN67_17640 [Pseudaminobacter manganicus]
MSAAVIVVEFDQFDFVPEMNNTVELALTRALNRTADRSRTRFARAAREQVNFPASYLSPSSKRLWVKTRARKGAFHTLIEGRGVPTSLARFTKQKPLAGGQRHKGGEIRVSVKPGRGGTIKRAFLMRLKNNNVGLAVRTNGEAPRGAYQPKAIGKNLWLLYGPSVDQALAAASDGGGIFDEMTPEAMDFLEEEFNRQMELLDG